MKFKLERKKTLQETIKFNLILSAVLVLIPHLLIYVLARGFKTQDVPFILTLFASILILSYLEFISRKKPIINNVFYVLYWISVIFAVLILVLFVILTIIAILFPLKWG